MASPRRTSPSLEALVSPPNLNNIALLQTLVDLSNELISFFLDKNPIFQRKNTRSLLRKIQFFVIFLDYIRESTSTLPYSANLCFKELYLLLHKSKLLLEYCTQSGKLWVLLQTHFLCGHFHDLNMEICTLLDVFPFGEMGLGEDVMEQMELLQKQSRKRGLVVDDYDEGLRVKLFHFWDLFDTGKIPEKDEIYLFFVEKLGIKDVRSFMVEIEFLEDKIGNHEGDIEPTSSVISGFVALARYCRFLLFGFEEDELKLKHKKVKKGGVPFVSVPKDFCCPISLDLMRDPVIVWSGQTYDRISISRWIEEGHNTCPKTGQILAHSRLVPNLALRNLIMQWCFVHQIAYDPLENPDTFGGSNSRAAIEANKATASLLIQQLANGSNVAKTVAAKEIRFLAKNGKENRAFIAEAGAIPYLKTLLSSPNAVAQENSITAMLNLSIYDKNKSRIMSEKGCLVSIVDVLRFGRTIEARENAAATLFSLSAVHEYKKRIAEEIGAVEALTKLLTNGTLRGKKDAVTALFNLSTHVDNCERMIDSGAVTSLVAALGSEEVAEEAAGTLALIVRQPSGARAVGNEEMAVVELIKMLRGGSPRGKENAVTALLELCRSGGVDATERVLKAPALASLLQMLLFTGTKRARRKAASLARVFQRCENSTSLNFGGYSFAASSAPSRDASFAGDVSMTMPIPVPVL